MLQFLSHTPYSYNNIWRVTSGCSLQHKPRRMSSELSLAHTIRFELTLTIGVDRTVCKRCKMGRKLDGSAGA